MKLLNDLVGKRYAASGAFTEVKIQNNISGSSVIFTAICNRPKYVVEGILYSLSEIRGDSGWAYRVQLMKLNVSGHEIDLKETRKTLKDKTNSDATYEMTLEHDAFSEQYSGRIINNIILIDTATLTYRHTNKSGKKSVFINIKEIAESFKRGFTNILYERPEKNIPINKSCIKPVHIRCGNSITLDIMDGIFNTEDPKHDAKPVYNYSIDKPSPPHITAAHIRRVLLSDGRIKIKTVAPYVVRPKEISQEVKDAYFLGPNGEISQETLLITKKFLNLEERVVQEMIAKCDIKTYNELVRKECSKEIKSVENE